MVQAEGLVVATRGRGHLSEGLVGQGGPAVGVCVRDGDPLLEWPPAFTGVEQGRSVEGERLLSLGRIRKLEDHRVLPEADDELPVPLHGRHAHHLRLLEVSVFREDVVDDLVEAGLCVHGFNLQVSGATPNHHPLSAYRWKARGWRAERNA